MTAQELRRPLPLGVYRLTADDFLLLDRSGAFESHAKTELVEGEIYFMNAQHRPHGYVKMRLYDALHAALRAMDSSLQVAVEVSVALTEHDVPEPDLTLTDEERGQGLIPARSVALLVEVSDTTLEEDLGRKQRIYAMSGVAEYWVADVNAKLIHQMSAPDAEAYTDHRTVPFGQRVEAMTIPGLAITPALD